MMEIRRAESEFEIEEARHLFREYQQSVGVPLCFQKFEEELASLPGYYSPPDGTLLITWFGDEAVGCGAVRKIAEHCCEMKRLYVRPNFRRLGIGRALAIALIEAAEIAGYDEMRLDTLRRLEAAVELYISLGFKEIPPYYENPLQEVLFFTLPIGAKHF
jgi:putative acetyltransferase